MDAGLALKSTPSTCRRGWGRAAREAARVSENAQPTNALPRAPLRAARRLRMRSGATRAPGVPCSSSTARRASSRPQRRTRQRQRRRGLLQREARAAACRPQQQAAAREAHAAAAARSGGRGRRCCTGRRSERKRSASPPERRRSWRRDALAPRGCASGRAREERAATVPRHSQGLPQLTSARRCSFPPDFAGRPRGRRCTAARSSASRQA